MLGLRFSFSYFGVNVTSLTTALGIGGLAISLAAKDTVSDAISGIIILVDQPFRVGDRIEIQGANTWEMSLILACGPLHPYTRQRMVIVPNSIIGNKQVSSITPILTHATALKLTFILIFMKISEMICQLLIDTIRQVDGVLADEPVDALFIDMTEGPIKFRLRRIESYADTRRMFDRVHTAIKHALDDAGSILLSFQIISIYWLIRSQPIDLPGLSERCPLDDSNHSKRNLPSDMG